MIKAQDYLRDIEMLAADFGLTYYPVQFEEVPPNFMTEVAVYGLPVRMPHWSFGVRYIYHAIQHRMGGSHIFEVVFPGNPGHAYLANTNSPVENILIAAHVLGHADFSRNNQLFQKVHDQVGAHIVEQAAAHAFRIREAIERFGQLRVERVLDAALSLEQYIDVDKPLSRPLYQQESRNHQTSKTHHGSEQNSFKNRFDALPGGNQAVITRTEAQPAAALPPYPEHDLLWFLAHYAPNMEDWERDIFLAVREESYYFHPVFSCQIMNEGWASYWHARLLREADFLSSDHFVEAMKTHSDVVRPYADENHVALSINPYHLGYRMWEHIHENYGMQTARQMMETEDDFSFIRNYLDDSLARELNLFHYEERRNGEICINNSDLPSLHDALLKDKYNFGAPHIAISEICSDGTLVLRHEHHIDGRGLDLQVAKKVLEYIQSIWRRPVKLLTIDGRGNEEAISVG